MISTAAPSDGNAQQFALQTQSPPGTEVPDVSAPMLETGDLGTQHIGQHRDFARMVRANLKCRAVSHPASR